MSDDWYPASRRPAAFRSITVRNHRGEVFHGLHYSTHRGGIIEPISNRMAEPVIGEITDWRYE